MLPVVGPLRMLCRGCMLPTVRLSRTRDGAMRCAECLIRGIIEREVAAGVVHAGERRRVVFVPPHAVLRFREWFGPRALLSDDEEVKDMVSALVENGRPMDAPPQDNGERYVAGSVGGVELVAVVFRSGAVKTVLTPEMARTNIETQSRRRWRSLD